MNITKPLVIVGGGLSGGLAAVEIARRQPNRPLLLLEEGATFGGNHIWSFFDSDIDADDRALLQDLSPHRWPDHDVCFPNRSRKLAIGYNSVRSADLDRMVRGALRPDQFRCDCVVAELHSNHVMLESGESIDAAGVIDARGPGPMPGLDLAWQKFVGRTYRFANPHHVARPTIMDATVDQTDGYRFVYRLPFSATELLIEDTYYSSSPTLDPPRIRPGLDAMAAKFGEANPNVSEETGVLPVLLGGDIEALWKESAVPLLGLRGGFFHPTTGYSLPDAVRNAALLAAQTDFSSMALTRLLRDRARHLWDERSFFQLLNRMLFRAAAPGQEYRVLEHFYRLPEPVIARFYAARLRLADKVRILTGRPPVPISRALAAMRKKTP